MIRVVTVLVIASLTAAPAAASVREAAFASTADRGHAQTSIFAGASYRVSWGNGPAEPRDRASLKLAAMARSADSLDTNFSRGIELTAGKTGKPALHIAGRDVGRLGTKTNMSGGTTAIVIGGVVLLGIVAALVVADKLEDERCIGEEGDCD